MGIEPTRDAIHAALTDLKSAGATSAPSASVAQSTIAA